MAAEACSIDPAVILPTTWFLLEPKTCVALWYTEQCYPVLETQKQILNRTHSFSKIRIKFQQVVQFFLQGSWGEGFSLVILQQSSLKLKWQHIRNSQPEGNTVTHTARLQPHHPEHISKHTDHAHAGIHHLPSLGHKPPACTYHPRAPSRSCKPWWVQFIIYLYFTVMTEAS